MPTITLPRHKITLAETVSWLAWDQCFSEENFTAAVGVEDHRKQISRLAEKLTELKEGQEALREKIHKNLESCQQKIDYGESLIRMFEEASGHRFSWPDDGASDHSIELDLFQKSISDVLLDLWEAAASGTINVWGKRKRNNEGVEENISRRWFWWSQNPPRAYLTHGYINHGENSAAKTEYIWRSVHFEKPEIEALEKDRARSERGLRATVALEMAVGFGFPFSVQPIEHDPAGVYPLMGRLTNGAWHATGWPVTDARPSKRETIPLDSWNFLIINFANNSASGGGKQFDGLRIFRGSPSPPAKKPGLKGERALRNDGGQEFTIGEIAVMILETHRSSPSVDLEKVIGWLFEQVEPQNELCVLFQDVPASEDGGVSEFWWKYFGDKGNIGLVDRGDLVSVSTKEMMRFCGSVVFQEWASARGLGVPASFDGEVEPQAHMIKSALELWSGGTTWVDVEYDERFGEALRPIPLDLRGIPTRDESAQEEPPPHLHLPQNDVTETTKNELTDEERSKGGRRSNINQALQDAINRIAIDLKKQDKKLTRGSLRDWVKDNTPPDEHERPEPFEFNPPIPNCDAIWIDGPKLVWTDRDGREQSNTFKNLDRYIERAQNFAKASVLE